MSQVLEDNGMRILPKWTDPEMDGVAARPMTEGAAQAGSGGCAGCGRCLCGHDSAGRSATTAGNWAQQEVVHGETEHSNLSVPQLVEVALTRGEGLLASNGAFVACTEPRTDCARGDRFIVSGGAAAEHVAWGQNARMEPRHFEALLRDVRYYCRSRTLFLVDGFAGADESQRLPVRLKCEYAWHSLFAHQLLHRPGAEEQADFIPKLEVVCAPDFEADPALHGTRCGAFVVFNLDRRLILIGGTRYAGEIRESIFTFLHYLMPWRGVLPMHGAAVAGQNGEVTLFLGVNGTGKTTLAGSPGSLLISDDQLAWGDHGVFAMEAGCYARCLDLDREKEPEIFEAVHFGSILENVVLNFEGEPDYTDRSITGNIRCAYPFTHLKRVVETGRGDHPERIILLVSDPSGVLPPVAVLSPEQAVYHFLNGYASGSTEAPDGQPPRMDSGYSACFAENPLPLPAVTYGELFGEKVRRHQVTCYLVNTGWTGNPRHGGHRIPLTTTRAIIRSIMDGTLGTVPCELESWFGFRVPVELPGVDGKLLQPDRAWNDRQEYDHAARCLAARLEANFGRYAEVMRAAELVRDRKQRDGKEERG